jgi:Transcriptional Coactivator p15 (PC4)
MKPIEILKNGGEKLVIETRQYRGHDILSVRTWYFNLEEQQWRAARQGLNMSLNRWKQIMPHLSQLLNEAERESVFSRNAMK